MIMYKSPSLYHKHIENQLTKGQKKTYFWKGIEKNPVYRKRKRTVDSQELGIKPPEFDIKKKDRR